MAGDVSTVAQQATRSPYRQRPSGEPRRWPPSLALRRPLGPAALWPPPVPRCCQEGAEQGVWLARGVRGTGETEAELATIVRP